MKNILTPGGCQPLPPGTIHVYNHHFQRDSSLKMLNQSKSSFMIWEGGKIVYVNVLGHMTKMAATPIYSKNLHKSSSLDPDIL